jgi:peptide/nickel transport system permease protein
LGGSGGDAVIGFLARRLVQAVIVIVGVLLLVFLMVHIVPGGEARRALGPRANAVQIRQFNKLNGLNLPLIDQFWHYLDRMAHGNLGYSYSYNQSVQSLIRLYLPRTLLLVGLSTLVALILAIPLGVLQVVRRNKPVDYVLTGLSFVFYAMPAFLLGTLLILWFAIDLGWFPVQFQQSENLGNILADPKSLVLPVFTLAALTIASFSRYMRSSMMEAMTQDYIRTAQAKGASPRRVLYGHALRNALIPILTLLGLSIPAIVSGALITETLFNYPGMGLLTVEAATKTDVPVLLGTTFIATVATVLGSLLADILYAVADPRIRYAR